MKTWGVLFDPDDLPLWASRSWYVAGPGYVLSAGGRHYFHREVMGAASGEQVDHVNGNRLDNRRCNLRLVTQTQNNQNMTARGGSSRFKGVTIDRRPGRGPFARIKTPDKVLFLGYFETEEGAARAYDAAAIHHFGQFARTNAQEFGI